MSYSSESSGYTSEDGDEDRDLPLAAGLAISQLELPDLTAHMIHETANEQLNRDFPVGVERMMGNGRGKRLDSLHRKANEMLKEMKSLRRQNLITHCLLGTMIVLTLGWQLSEVSVILALKEGFTNPFRSVGKALSRMVKRRSLKDSVIATREESPLPALSLLPAESSPMLPLKIPGLLKCLDISKWGQNSSGH